MMPLSRRAFLHAAAVAPIASWGARARLRAQGPLTRFDARTQEGIAMLEKYARAVAIMKDPMRTQPGNPSSWRFQWFTHWTPDDKATLIDETYPKGQPAAWRNLANKTWATCQAHFQPQAREPFFLPWHRWYLSFFEAIVRAALQDATFTLPYWDYSQDAALPPQFTMRNDSTFGSLFHERGSGVNGKPVSEGDPIMDVDAIRRMVHDALCQNRYPIRSFADPGFCAHLDFNLHGDIHGAIGGDMQSVPTAAQDPIFWLHHCNIDRLWVSWNANGGRNPTDTGFRNERFTFADSAGAEARRIAGDALDPAALGYKYDRLEPRPADCPAAERETTAAPVLTHRATGVALGADVTRVTLSATPAAARETAPTGRLFLVIRGVAAPATPGTLYEVFVNLPADASAAERRARLVGHINFFDLTAHQNHRPRQEKFFTYDITNVVRAAGGQVAGISVTIAPRQSPAKDVSLRVQEIQVLRR